MQIATAHGRRTHAALDGALAYGALSDLMKDNLYWFGPCGFIFTSPWVVTPKTVRHAAVVLLTASGEPVEVTAGKRVVRHDAVAIAPLTPRGLRAMDVGLISVQVFPPNPCFRAFQNVPAPGVLALDRTRLAEFDPAIARAYEGRLTLREAQQLFDGVVDATVRQLPRTGPCDCRVNRLHEILRENPACSLRELAQELRLSYTGTSHYFSRAVGLPLRSYRLWLKYFTAANLRLRGGTLTKIAHAAGFTDSSHLSHTWQASYGLSPSYSMDRKRVRTFT
jgi:AraC family transcriptional regulator, arabinose operon regulatory protein